MVNSMDIDSTPTTTTNNKSVQYVNTQYGRCELQTIRDDGVAIVKLPFQHTALMYANVNTLSTNSNSAKNKRTSTDVNDDSIIDEPQYIPMHKRVMSAPAYRRNDIQPLLNSEIINTTPGATCNTPLYNKMQCIDPNTITLDQRSSSLPRHCANPMFV